MRMDSKRAGGVAIFGVIALLLIWGLLSLLPNTAVAPISETPAGQQAASAPMVTGPNVVVVHTSKSGMHTYSGQIQTPSSCYAITSSTSVSYAVPTVVTLALTTQLLQGSHTCSPGPIAQQFATELSSKTMPQFSLTVDGKPAQVTLKEQ